MSCRNEVNIPVFHDDQHGTAIVILAALIKALQMTGKKKEAVSVVINGAGRSRNRSDENYYCIMELRIFFCVIVLAQYIQIERRG